MWKRTHVPWLLALAALGTADLATVSASSVAIARPGGVECSIRVVRDSGAVTLEPMVTAASAISGSYRLRVIKRGGGGGSNIDQSGDFSASAGRSTALGRVSLAGGGSYDARLTIDTGGRTVECSERVGGSI